MLFVSLFVCVSMVSVNGTSLTGVVYVENEVELNNAVNAAKDISFVVIAFNKDITLTVALVIPVNTNRPLA
jgi:hypothetical protein